jgi:hypothetical protein
VVTVGVVTPGTLSAGALAASAIVATTVIAKTAAIRLPWTIQGASYLDGRVPKPVNAEAARGVFAGVRLGRVRRCELRVLGVLPRAAPPIDGQ